jgi:hypothetical protein
VRWSRSSEVLVLLLGAASSARADEAYFGASIDDLAALTFAGVDDGTNWELTDLADGRVVSEGTVDRYGVATVSLGTIRHFGLSTTAPIVAYLGRDCCAVGGTTFVPTAEGHARVGRVFVLDFPLLPADALSVFALEDADLTVQATTGAVVVARHVNAGDAWIAWGLRGETPYLLRSTGDLVLQLNVPNGDESVPPTGRTASCDQDVGDSFLLATHPWATGSVAVFAYEDADVTLTRLGDLLPTDERTLGAGSFEYFDDLGLENWLVRATGRVGVWTGDTEGGDGISWMGDDVTQNVGDRGRDVLVHTQTHGATVFAATDGTVVDAGRGPVTLDAGGFLDLAAEQLVRVSASAPVLVQTSGGNTMNDWGTFLRPIPRADGPFDCPDRDDIELAPPVDAGVPGPDGGADAGPGGDGGGPAVDGGPADDASVPAQDAAPSSTGTPRGGGCGCGVAGIGPGVSLDVWLVGVSLLWLSCRSRSTESRYPRGAP